MIVAYDKIVKDTCETSETCSRATTSDMKIIWDVHVNLFEKTYFSTPKWPESRSRGEGCAQNLRTGMIPSERASNIIMITTPDDPFDPHLTHDNLGQRITGNTLWRTTGFWHFAPRKRVLRTMSLPGGDLVDGLPSVANTGAGALASQHTVIHRSVTRAFAGFVFCSLLFVLHETPPRN